MPVLYPKPQHPPDAEHITIYYNRDEFAAWPFNHGLWAFPNGELLISFSRGPCSYQNRYDMSHSVVDALGGEYVALRSTDGGRTWPLEGLVSLGTRLELERRLRAHLAPATPIDFTSPDLCLSAGFGIPPKEARHIGYIQFSRNRGQTWEGPFPMPAFGFAWVQVKVDYLVRPDGLVLLFVTVGKGDGRPGDRFVAVYATTDGGLTWNYLSAIQPTTPDAGFVNRYYASPLLLPDGRILAALRCQIDARNAWPELFESEDGGCTWRFVTRISEWGGPTHLLRLDDGRLVASYGYRSVPYGIRARLSEDEGYTWGAELILRDDAGSWDLGYPRAVQLADRQVLVAYYHNLANDPVQCDGGVRHIAGTIFRP
ncbi:MAG: exo-alpha-sialidase [Chloroflexi bacterium]|nr:exo-alpha-sialidase [Chloroflexota bacterium]